MRFVVLHFTQSHTFKKASGLIFLTQYAKTGISAKISISHVPATIIPHGISASFSQKPREQKEIADYHQKIPFRFLYVSIVTAYKHQWNVAKAIGQLREQGYPVVLELIGPKSKEGYDLLVDTINEVDPKQDSIHYHWAVAYTELHQHYKRCDAFVFASSCENLPIILLEAMSAGLPIASSDKGPMPEVLKDFGVYFDPENVGSIANSLKYLMDHKNIR